MNITSAKYVTIDGTTNDHIEIVVDGIKMSVPINEDNTHYQAIQEWVAEGGVIEEADV